MAELVSLSITQAPNKTRYVVGDRFERYGMVVRANYSDGTSSPVDNYSLSPSSALTASATRISVSFEGKTTYQSIVVANPPTTGYFMDKCIDSAVCGGNPYVNAADGSFRFRCSPFSVERDSHQLSVSLSYNSRMTDRESDLIKGMMRGFRTNYHQFLVQDGRDAGNVDLYKYIDGEGYVHTFVYNQAFGAYFDKEGKGFLLDTTSRTITDTANNVLSFDQSGRLISVRSGLNPSDVKRIEYNSDGLRKVYDERNLGTYIRYSYEFSCLRWIKVFYEGELLRTYNLYGFMGQITSIDESAGNETRTLYQFAFNDRNKVNRFVDCLTKEAYRLTYAFDSDINDYRFDSLRKGYMEDGHFVQQEGSYFSETRTDPSASYGLIQELIVRDDNDIEMSYMMDSEGTLVSTLERDCGVSGYYKPLIRDRGEWVPFQGDCQDYISDSRAFSVPGDITVGCGLGPGSLNGEKDLKLIGYVKIKGRPEKARVSFEADHTLSDGVEINPKAYDVWQYFEIPFRRETGADGNPVAFGSFRLFVYDEELSEFNADVANLQWAIGEPAQKLFIEGQGSAVCVDDLDAIRLYTSYYDYANIILSESERRMTDSDLLSTIIRYKSNPDGRRIAYFDDGKFLMPFSMAVVGVASGETVMLLDTIAQGGTDASLFFADRPDSESKTRYLFRDGYYEVVSPSKNDSGEPIETKRRFDYRGQMVSENNGLGATVHYEYFEDGTLRKKTVECSENGVDRSIVIYEAERGEGGKYVTRIAQEGDVVEFEYDGYCLKKTTKVGMINGQPVNRFFSLERSYNAFKDGLSAIRFKDAGTTVEEHSYSRPSASFRTNDIGDTVSRYRLSRSIADKTISLAVLDQGGYSEVLTRREGTLSASLEYNNCHSSGGGFHTIEKSFDPYGNILGMSHNGCGGASFSYAENHASQFSPLVSCITDSFSGNSVEYSYGSSNEVTSVSVGGFAAIKTKYPEGRDVIVESFSPNEAHAIGLDSSFATLRGDDENIKTICWSYVHDALGRVTKKKVSAPESGWEMAFDYSYSADYPSRVTGWSFLGGSISESYLYNDPYGHITGIESVFGTSTHTSSYQYDGFGRMVREDNTELNIHRTYIYGVGGETGGPLGRMVRFGNADMVYDERGRLTEFGSHWYRYDEYGNRVSKDADSYQWERGNLLSCLNSCRYTYDYRGIRSSRLDSNGKRHDYHYLGDKLVGEDVYSASGTLQMRLRFFYDRDGLSVLRKFDSSGHSSDFVYLRNAFGDIIALCQDDGQSRSVVARYVYDAWGNHMVYGSNGTVDTSPTFIGNINPFRYRGYYFDSDTNLYYLMSRYYDSEIGQFISPDDFEYIGFESISGINLYAYRRNNSLNISIFPSTDLNCDKYRFKGAKTTDIFAYNDPKRGFNWLSALFGYELRESTGWDTSPEIATSWFGRIGFSSYTTSTQGKSGVFYVFAGTTSDTMNWFSVTHYAGIGVSACGALGVEFQLETIGVGAQLNFGNLIVSASINLIGATSITLALGNNLGNGRTNTNGFTIGVNTGALVAIVVWIYKIATTGDVSYMPSFQQF